SWYGLTEEEAEEILRDLETIGALISIPGDSSPTPDTRWGSPEHLEGAYAATLARRRREAKPATVAQYQQFLLTWQRRAGRQQTKGGGGQTGSSHPPGNGSATSNGEDEIR